MLVLDVKLSMWNGSRIEPNCLTVGYVIMLNWLESIQLT